MGTWITLIAPQLVLVVVVVVVGRLTLTLKSCKAEPNIIIELVERRDD